MENEQKKFFIFYLYKLFNFAKSAFAIFIVALKKNIERAISQVFE